MGLRPELVLRPELNLRPLSPRMGLSPELHMASHTVQGPSLGEVQAHMMAHFQQLLKALPHGQCGHLWSLHQC